MNFSYAPKIDRPILSVRASSCTLVERSMECNSYVIDTAGPNAQQ
jgi:hypothetical protein